MSKDKEKSQQNKKPAGSFLDKLLGLVAALGVLASTAITFRYVVRLQHMISSDGDFFAGNSIWLKVQTALAKLFGMDVVSFTHSVFSVVFVVAVCILYFVLGLRLFALEERGKLYTFTMTCIFLTTFLLILHMGSVSPLAIEGGAYLAPWQGRIVAGILSTPILMLGLIRVLKLSAALDTKKDEKTVSISILGIVEIVIAAFLNLISNSIDSLKELKGLRIETLNSYIGVGWLFGAAALAMIIIVMYRWKTARLFIIIILATMVMLVPAPMGLIAAYFVAKLVGWKKDSPVISLIIWGALSVAIAVAGVSSKSRSTYGANFLPIENKYKIAGYYIEAGDFIIDDSAGKKGILVNAVGERYAGMVEYSISHDMHMLVNKLGEGAEGDNDINELMYKASENGGYVVLHSSIQVSDEILNLYGFERIKDIGEVSIYGETNGR